MTEFQTSRCVSVSTLKVFHAAYTGCLRSVTWTSVRGQSGSSGSVSRGLWYNLVQLNTKGPTSSNFFPQTSQSYTMHPIAGADLACISWWKQAWCPCMMIQIVVPLFVPEEAWCPWWYIYLCAVKSGDVLDYQKLLTCSHRWLGLCPCHVLSYFDVPQGLSLSTCTPICPNHI